MRAVKRVIKRLLGIPAPPPPPRNKALWAIGLYSGASPLALHADTRWPGAIITRDQVTDIPAGFVADPFLIHASGTWNLFFEALNRRNNRGEIGLATSPDLVAWQYQRIVLAEPFHLSYPQVFEWQGDCYMIPETNKTRSIRLYRADPFPTQWTPVHTLMTGLPYSDATLFRHDDRWWLFTETSAMKHDTLRLYFADDLLGAWTEHPASPIVQGNARTARPAGPIVPFQGRLIRFAQDCAPRYGMGVAAFEIDELTPTRYAERLAPGNPIMSGSGTGWNATRMHHVDAHAITSGEWIAAVDGACETTAADIAGAA